jgi:hypothetical protein
MLLLRLLLGFFLRQQRPEEGECKAADRMYSNTSIDISMNKVVLRTPSARTFAVNPAMTPLGKMMSGRLMST